MENSLPALLSERLPKLSKGHKKIAEYILNHYDKAAFMTASKLGNIVGVSESTVVRFATELGFEGYPEMQKALKEFTSNKLTTVQRMNVMNDQLAGEDVLSRVLNFDIEQIRKTLDEIDKEEFYTTVDALVQAKNIYVIGARSASVLARFIVFYFNIMFDNVKIIHTTSTSEMFEQILNVGEGDIMIGVSFPRYSKHTVKAFRYAHEERCKGNRHHRQQGISPGKVCGSSSAGSQRHGFLCGFPGSSHEPYQRPYLRCGNEEAGICFPQLRASGIHLGQVRGI